MITNERQYRITKAQAENFENAISSMSNSPAPDSDIHPIIWEAQKTAASSQLADLQEELREYETLRSGARRAWVLPSFEELPKALIQARIATGMSQKEFAEQLGLKEQQLQRYEASNYSGASWTRLCEVMKALGVSLKGDFAVSPPVTSPQAFIKKLTAAGVDKQLLYTRLLPLELALQLHVLTTTSPFKSAEELWDTYGDARMTTEATLREASACISRVFSLPQDDLLIPSHPLQLDMAGAGAPRFKVKRKSNTARVAAYTLYAHYLALVVLQGTAHLPRRPLPRTDREVWQAIKDGWGEVNFHSTLNYVWSLGIPVVPMEGSGGFHGACWRDAGRNIIVLKQQTSSFAAWLHDLLHELWHAMQEPENPDFNVIEEEPTSEERLLSPEEQKANTFAGIVELDGKANSLVELCIQKAGGRIPALKQAVRQVAEEKNAPVDRLANFLAYRISIDPNLQGENWWGVAATFQQQGNPWMVARDVLREQLNWDVLSPFDKQLLQRALASQPSEM